MVCQHVGRGFIVGIVHRMLTIKVMWPLTQRLLASIGYTQIPITVLTRDTKVKETLGISTENTVGFHSFTLRSEEE